MQWTKSSVAATLLPISCQYLTINRNFMHSHRNSDAMLIINQPSFCRLQKAMNHTACCQYEFDNRRIMWRFHDCVLINYTWRQRYWPIGHSATGFTCNSIIKEFGKIRCHIWYTRFYGSLSYLRFFIIIPTVHLWTDSERNHEVM
jgi:hypothetical protein